MSFKKVIQGDFPVIIGNHSDESDLFLPGFCYCIEGTIYTVIENVTKDPHASLRKIITGEGDTEIVSIETIQKDLRSFGAKVLPVDKKYIEKKEEISSSVLPEKVKKSVKKLKKRKKKKIE